MTVPATVPVALGERSYNVVVGPGTRRGLAELLPPRAARAAIVTQDPVGVSVDTGRRQATFSVPDGEGAKSLPVVEGLCRAFARFGLTRADVVVGVGGGVVTDLAGFAAAVYMRGIPVAHVATTLLAQVDAAIGGKTGVNLAEGKNMVGAFWQPCTVVCDTEVLATLPPRQWASGRGEVAKYAFLGVDELTRLSLEDQVVACVRRKVAAVTADEREAGQRALLNYGHTLAHALETAGRYDLSHGEAVGVGLAFAARLARRLGRIDDAGVEEHDRVVTAFGLSTALPPSDPDRLIDLMAHDKKAVDGLTFVLDGPSGVEVVPGVAPDAVRATLAEMAAP